MFLIKKILVSFETLWYFKGSFMEKSCNSKKLSETPLNFFQGLSTYNREATIFFPKFEFLANELLKISVSNMFNNIYIFYEFINLWKCSKILSLKKCSEELLITNKSANKV